MNELLLSVSLFAADLAALGADSWRDREAATLRLIRAGLPAIPAVEWLAEASPSPEVRGRCGQVVTHFYHVTPSDGGVLPWLCDGSKYSDRSDRCKELLRRAVLELQPENHDPDYGSERHATYLWVREELRRGVPRADVVRSLDAMRALEREWQRNHQPRVDNDGR